MNFLKAENLPELKTWDKIDSNEQVIYLNELQSLSVPNREKFHRLAKLKDKAYKAVDEEKNVEKILAEFIKEQEAAYGPLFERVNNVKQKHQVLTELEIESNEIKNPRKYNSFWETINK